MQSTAAATLDLEFEHRREMQEELAALQAKCEVRRTRAVLLVHAVSSERQSLEAQSELQLSEKDAVIDALQAELSAAQDAAQAQLAAVRFVI
jgi:hypothetical protein